MAIFIAMFAGCKREKTLEIEQVNIQNISDIIPVSDSLIIPVDYLEVIPLDTLDIESRKQKFIDIILPPILITKFKLSKLYDQVNRLAQIDSNRLDREDRQLLDSLLIKYRSGNMNELKLKLRTHPVSIVIAQAALECAWGTSRFFYEANNPFGIWSFYDDEPRIASLHAREEEQVYLKKYFSLTESVESYFYLIATGPYSKFREKRIKTSKVNELVPYLYNYSELRSDYVRMIKDIIRQNDLTKYDQYEIDPDYIH